MRMHGSGVRWTRVVAVAASATVLLAGGGGLDGSSSDSPSNGGGQGEKSRVRVGIIASIDDAPVKLAQAKGFFQQEGLDVEVKLFQSAAQTTPALNSGDLDFSLMNYVTFFQSAAAGTLDAKIVADAYQGTTH